MHSAVADPEGGEKDVRPLQKKKKKESSRIRKYYVVSVNKIHKKSLPFHHIVIFAHLTVVHYPPLEFRPP